MQHQKSSNTQLDSATANAITYKRIPSAKGARIAISNRLYIPGWLLRSKLDSFIDVPLASRSIFIAYDTTKKDEKNPGGKPIGLLALDGREVQIFVRKAYRRKGIGTGLFKCMKRFSKQVHGYYGAMGVEGSQYFFAKHDVNI